MDKLCFWDKLAIAVLAFALLVVPGGYVLTTEVESSISRKRDQQACLSATAPSNRNPAYDPCRMPGQAAEQERNVWIHWGEAATSTFFAWLTCYVSLWLLVWIARFVRSWAKARQNRR